MKQKRQPSDDVENYYLVTQVQHMCAESLRYFDISKQVYLLGFVTQNESGLFDLFNFFFYLLFVFDMSQYNFSKNSFFSHC